MPLLSNADATPFYFDAAGTRCFAWLHRGNGHPHRGVVLCNPFGYEAICAHRALRYAANAFASNGYPTVRFDYPGTGDSGDPSAAGPVFDRWVESAAAAAESLYALGLDSLVYVGIRLGAAIAAVAASRDPRARGVVLVGGTATGREFLRQSRALQRAFTHTLPNVTRSDREDEVLGFALPREDQARLAELHLIDDAPLAGKHVLLLQDPAIPASARFHRHLEQSTASLKAGRAIGLGEMLLDPHLATPPKAIVQDIVRWLGLRPEKPVVATAHASRAAWRPPSQELALPNGVTESVMPIEAAAPLVGILTRPSAAASPSGLAFMLLNVGAGYRIGPNRLYVELARRFAARGHTVLRLDIAGIGDSTTRLGEADNVVYPAFGIEDVLAAQQALERLNPGASIHLLGVCSGAYHALQAAARSHRTAGIVVINPLTYFWDYAKARPVGDPTTSQRATRLRNRSLSWAEFGVVLRRPRRLVRAVDFLYKRVRQLAIGRALALCRVLRIPLKRDLADLFGELVRRNVAILVVFSEQDPGRDLMRVLAGSRVEQLAARGSLGLSIIADAGHTFALRRHHSALVEVLDRHVLSLEEKRAR